MLSVFSLGDNKWQFSLFEQPSYLQSYYLSINEYISENLAKKYVTNLYLQKSVISYSQFDTLCLPSTLSCELTVLDQICYGLCKMLSSLGLEVVFPQFLFAVRSLSFEVDSLFPM